MRNQLLSTLIILISTCTLFAQDTAPDFTVTTAHGETFNLYDHLDNGQTVLVKFFFAACPPCNGFAPISQTLYQEWGAGQADVEFIGLSILSSDTDSKVIEYEEEHALTYPGAGRDGDSVAATEPYTDGDFGSFTGTPTFAVISPDRSIELVQYAGKTETPVILDSLFLATGAVKPIVSTYNVSGQVLSSNETNIADAQVNITSELGTATYNSPFSLQGITANSSITINEVIAPANIAPQTAVSTYDLVLISQHIIGTTPFEQAYQSIAADANNDGNITTFDIILLRQLILYAIEELPGGIHWKSFVGLPSELELTDLKSLPMNITDINTDINDLNFTLVKMGDVSGDFSTTQAPTPLKHSGKQLIISAVNNTPNSTDFSIKYLRLYQGFQAALTFNPDEIEIDSISNHYPSIFSTLDINLQAEEGIIRISWLNRPSLVIPDSPLFTVNFSKKTSAELTDIFELNTEYMPAEAYYKGELADLCFNSNCNDLTNISPIEERPNVTVFPNPTTEILNIKWQQTNEDFIKIELFNMQGQLIKNVYTGKINAGMQLFSAKTMDFTQSTFILRISNRKTILHSQVFTKM